VYRRNFVKSMSHFILILEAHKKYELFKLPGRRYIKKSEKKLLTLPEYAHPAVQFYIGRFLPCIAVTT
jgi:hypothetical protein